MITDNSNIVVAAFEDSRSVVTRRLWKIDKGMKLQITGLDLPEAYQVHFSNTQDVGQAQIVVATSDTVEIPYDYLQTGKYVYVWIYLNPEQYVGYTAYTITIPVSVRPTVTDVSPTPPQQNAIDQAIGALNDAVEQTGADAAAADESAQSAAGSATLAESWAVGGTGTRTGEDTDNASYYADMARQHAADSGWAWFDINDSTGEMMVTVSDNLSEDVTFAINENTGELEVTVA